MRFARYLHISGNERMPYVAEKYIQLLAAPSAVHLAVCISTRFSASRTLCARICCFDLRFNGFGVFEFSSIYYAWCKMLNIFLGQN